MQPDHKSDLQSMTHMGKIITPKPHWEMMKRMSSNLMCLMAVDQEVFD
jgi:hypothetical protein